MGKDKHTEYSKNIRKIRSLLLICSLAISLETFADTITFRNGKVLENVKSRVTKETVEITFETGKTESHKKGAIKGLKIRSVVWKSKEKDKKKQEEEARKQAEEEKSRISEASEKGSDWEPRAEEDQISPWGNAALGLIPGFSGQFRTQNYLGGGILASLKFASFIFALDYITAKELPHKTTSADVMMFNWYLTGGGVSSSSSSGSLGSFPLIFLSSAFGEEKAKIGGITHKELQSQTGEYAKKEREFNTRKGIFIGVFAAVTLTDVLLSYFSASSWNEGTYSGEKSPGFQKPTTAAGRFARSFFVPGFGELYAGETGKGLTFLTLAIAAVGNALKAENDVKKAVVEYNDIKGYTLVMGSAWGMISVFDFSTMHPLVAMELLSRGPRENLESAVQKRNQAWTLYGGIWLTGLIDAIWFSGKEKAKGVYFKPDFRISPATTPLAENKLNTYYGARFEYVF